MLYASLEVSVGDSIIGENKVVNGVRLNLGLRLQSPGVENGAVKTPSAVDVDDFKGVSQQGEEYQTEERRG